MLVALIIACTPNPDATPDNAPPSTPLPGSAVPSPPPPACTVDDQDGVGRATLTEQSLEHTWMTPVMDQTSVTGSVTRVAGSGPWTVSTQHLWHLDCGDGLFAGLEWGEVTSGPVTVEADGGTLTIHSDETGTFEVSVPLVVNVSNVSALGCDDRYEGEVLHTTAELTITLVEPTWQLEPQTEALLEGRPVALRWRPEDASGAELQVGDPDSEIVAIDGACLVEDTGVWAFGAQGQVRVELDGSPFATFPLVDPTEITDLELLVTTPDGPMAADAELGPSDEAEIRVASLGSPEGTVRVALPADGFEASGTGSCTVESGLDSRFFLARAELTGSGTCTLQVEHLSSGSIATHSFMIVD